MKNQKAKGKHMNKKDLGAWASCLLQKGLKTR